AGLARPLSHWVKTSASAKAVAADTATAIAEARRGRIASLIVPGDCAWDEADGPAATPAPETRVNSVPAVEKAARVLCSGDPTLLVIGGRSIRGKALELAGRIAGKTSATLATQFFSARIERGAGRVPTFRIPYFVEPALKSLSAFRHFVTI